jgi:membrane-associated protease RseP (regulator of RpoE activity)
MKMQQSGETQAPVRAAAAISEADQARKHFAILGTAAIIAALLLAPIFLVAQQPGQVAGQTAGWVGIVGAPTGGTFPVINIESGSPAASAGVQVGDTLLSVNGVSVADSLPLARVAPGQALTLELRRDGRNRTITLFAIARPGRAAIDEIRAPTAVADPDHISRDVVRSVGDPGPAPGAAGQAAVTAGPASGDTIRGGIRAPQDTSPIRPAVPPARRAAGNVSPPTPAAASAGVQRAGRAERASQPDRQPPAAQTSGGTTQIFSGRPSVLAGAQLDILDPELATYFRGATDGVLVVRVAQGTPAAQRGLRAGDVIQMAGSTRVRHPRELQAALAAEADAVITVIRQGQRVRIPPR